MKRAITTSVVAGLLGTLGFAPAVSAEGTLYGSLRTGVYMVNPDDDGDTTWNIGTVDDSSLASNQLFSRIGVKASHELDGGVTAGLHIEKHLDGFSTRIQKATISGDFGTLAVGQMWTTFRNATSIDGAYFLGGNSNLTPGREAGVMYSSSLGGPFNFSAMVSDDNSGDGGQGDGLNIVQFSGTLNVGGVSLSAAIRDVEDGNENIAVKASGSFGPLGYAVGGGTRDAPGDGVDVDAFGAYVSYSVMDGGVLYVEFEDVDSDTDADDNNHLLLGYAHNVAPGFTVITEFTTPDSGSDVGTVALKVDF